MKENIKRFLAGLTGALLLLFPLLSLHARRRRAMAAGS